MFLSLKGSISVEILDVLEKYVKEAESCPFVRRDERKSQPIQEIRFSFLSFLY